jgi:phosphoglucosamine mutase
MDNMKKLFGTDGIRAAAGKFPLDPLTIRVLGGSLSALLREEGLEPMIIVGRDTRESGAWMEEALVQGFKDAGGEAVSAGVIPTSAISFLTRKHAFSAGLVLSASHNPYHDNGIKIFSSDGTKIRDDWEVRLEKAILRSRTDAGPKKAVIRPEPGYLEEYADFLKGRMPASLVPGKFRVVLDCSNGASSVVAPRVFRELGFEVIPIHDAPDGRNINRGCGSLHPAGLAKKVIAERAVLGIAYDGDADRAVWVDEKGRVLNGDHTLYIQALFMKEKRRLRSAKVVATSMSNMGLERALREEGLELVRTRVGDKYVLEEMSRLGANLGGEQSGHTIFLDDCPTGDGILTSLKMAEVLLERGRPLSELAAGCGEYPQVLVSVKVIRKADFGEFPEIARTAEDIRAALGEDGRLDLRYSGTEPLARIMIEGREKEEIETHAGRLADVIGKFLGK